MDFLLLSETQDVLVVSTVNIVESPVSAIIRPVNVILQMASVSAYPDIMDTIVS